MSELAQSLIAANKKHRDPFLDLGLCGLTAIPPEIRELSWLRHLNLSDAHVIPWPEVGVSREGRQAAGHANSQLADLAPIAGNTALRSLNISGTQVVDVSPLAGLANLQEFVARDTRIQDLFPLAGLKQLRRLILTNSALCDLTALRPLIEAGYPVLWLRPLIDECYPVVWTAEPLQNGIFVHGCPLTTPPPEVVQQGNEAILNYFRERDAGEVDYLYEAKLLILGEGGAGKTSLLRRLYQPGAPLPGESESTHGIDIHRHDFTLPNSRRFRLNVWDFGGQEIYHATHQFFLTRRSLYVLVDDTRKDDKSVQDDSFKYPLELIDLFGDHSPVLIFQNEKGGRSKGIDLGGIKGRFDNVQGSYSGNLEFADGADALRAAIEFHAGQLGHIGDELPARWIKVREAIEAAAALSPHITQQAYFDLYARHLPFDRTKALHLSQYFHDLGVFLHFQDEPRLAGAVILQNQWATTAVFRILDDEAVKGACGRFGWADCLRLWGDAAYADMHLELLALMQRFELCYPLADHRPEAWLAPQLLPAARPAALPAASPGADLVLRYRYDFMPKGLVSRLIVRLNRFVADPDKAWRTGALFEQDGSHVLVEILPKGGEIELRARGAERKELLSVVAAELDALNDSFHGLRDKVEKRIPCNCSTCARAPAPGFFDRKILLKYKERGIPEIRCEVDLEMVKVLALLDGLQLEAGPGLAAPRTIRIFLASSAELKGERDAFDLFIRQQNDRLLERGVYLKVVRWEHFLDAMSDTRLQDEYNRAVRECDVFVSLFFTKTGKFTEEEFDTAHHQFLATGKPRIYTYFKNADVKTGEITDEIVSLLAFKKKLDGLGHFHTGYADIEHLKRQFREQLDVLIR